MRRRDYSTRKKRLSLIKLFVLIAVAILLVVCIAVTVLYKQAIHDKEKGFAKAASEAIDQTELVNMSSVERFDGKRSYYIVYGKSKDEAKKIAFIPVSKKDKPVIIDESKILSKQQAVKEWGNECNSCTLIRSTAAMIDKEPLWEITYRDQSDHYVFQYLSMKDGKTLETFRLAQTTNR